MRVENAITLMLTFGLFILALLTFIVLLIQAIYSNKKDHH